MFVSGTTSARGCALVRNTYFHDAYARFGLYESPGIIVEDCVFERGGPFFVGDAGVGWLEGPPLVSNVTIRSNVARDFHGGAAAFNVRASGARIASMTNNSCFGADGEQVNPCT